ncbi:MAG: phosphatidate cytidylyltransferase [Chloroflexi bacterium]|nr:phosphatidate cytidylyltransferase [Chloroflexota bacterium]
MLHLRLLSALVLIPIPVAAGWFGEPWTSLVVGVSVAAAAYEFGLLAERAGCHPLRWAVLLLALAFFAAASLEANTGRSVVGLVLAGAVILVLAGRLLRRQATTAFADWGVTLGGAIWTGWLLSHFILLRALPDGRSWVILALLLTFASDTAAYAIGRWWGRHPLAPAISPAKTVEGALGALLLTLLVALALSVILGLAISPLAAVLLGLAASLGAQLGDLAESAVKRAAQVKDASMLIPGHGGVLDRIDSLAVVAVVLYFLYPLLTAMSA